MDLNIRFHQELKIQVIMKAKNRINLNKIINISIKLVANNLNYQKIKIILYSKNQFQNILKIQNE